MSSPARTTLQQTHLGMHDDGRPGPCLLPPGPAARRPTGAPRRCRRSMMGSQRLRSGALRSIPWMHRSLRSWTRRH